MEPFPLRRLEAPMIFTQVLLQPGGQMDLRRWCTATVTITGANGVSKDLRRHLRNDPHDQCFIEVSQSKGM